MEMIQTAQGPKTPFEAFIMLTTPGTIKGGDQLGILRQLWEKDPEMGTRAAIDVIAHKERGRYGPKVVALATEIKSGRPVGPKMLEALGRYGLLEVLKKIGPGATYRITFRADRPDRVRTVLALTGLVRFTEPHAFSDLGAVRISGEWQRISRVWTVTIMGEFETVADNFIGTVESIELRHTFHDFVHAIDPCPRMLTANPDLFFDEWIFRDTLQDMGRMNEALYRLGMLGKNPSIVTVTECFEHLPTRIDFLEHYIARFNQALGITAKAA